MKCWNASIIEYTSIFFVSCGLQCAHINMIEIYDMKPVLRLDNCDKYRSNFVTSMVVGICHNGTNVFNKLTLIIVTV